MTATLISSAGCPSVRAAIDISITAEMLPDEKIMLDIFAGVAAREVRTKVPDLDTRPESELERLRTATVYFTAANIVKAVPQMISENIGGYHYQIKSSDPNQRYLDLRAVGESEIQEVLDTDDESDLISIFMLASGRRGVGLP